MTLYNVIIRVLNWMQRQLDSSLIHCVPSVTHCVGFTSFCIYKIQNSPMPLSIQELLFNILKRNGLTLHQFFSTFHFARNVKIIFETVLTVSEMKISAINACSIGLVLWILFLVKVCWRVEIQIRLEMFVINLARVIVIVIIVFHS